METFQSRLSPIRPFRHDFWLNLLACAATGGALSIFFQKSYGSCGDYPQHFNACWWGMGIGAVVGLLFNLLHGKIPYAWRLRPVLTGFLRFFLAWIILAYAVAKIIPVQFPHLIANLDNTFNELTPMRVAWTFFGYSEGYQMMMGWAEAVPAILLLFRRTHLLGALLMVTVLVNVVAVNIFFDVCVKLNSSIYLGIALFLLIQSYDRLWAFFFAEKAVPPPQNLVLFQNPKTRRAARIGTGLLIALLLGYTIFKGTSTFEYYVKQNAPTPVAGIWVVERMERLQDTTWQAVPTTDSLYFDRIYFQGIYGVFKGPSRRDRVTFEADSVGQTIQVTFISPSNERPAQRVWQYEQLDLEHLSLTGTFWNDSLRVGVVRKE